MEIKIKKLHPGAKMPAYATADAACFDLHAATVAECQCIGSGVHEGYPITCETGLAFEIPQGNVMLIFGRSGSVNLLLDDWFGFNIPLMEGLTGVVFVESIHYFPFILLNLVAAMRNIDGAMEESALNLGARGWRLFRRVIFPLAMPGYLAGATLVFVKVFDDLGTPLVMGITNMLAPQAYLRITSVGLDDPQGYVISVIMIAFSILALWLAALVAALLGGFAYSRILENHGQRMLDRNFKPGFKAWMHQKDLRIVMEEAHRLGLMLPRLRPRHRFSTPLSAAAWARTIRSPR